MARRIWYRIRYLFVSSDLSSTTSYQQFYKAGQRNLRESTTVKRTRVSYARISSNRPAELSDVQGEI